MQKTWVSYSVFNNFNLQPLNSVSLRSYYLHLAMLAIKLQAETLAIATHQIIRLLERRLLLVANRTPTHAIAQTMFAEHQYGICSRTLLESRSNLRYSMLAIEGC